MLTCVWCGWAGVLLVADNGIGAAGATKISEALAVNTVLTELCFAREHEGYWWRNSIGDAGATSISEALAVNTVLTQLVFEGEHGGVG